MDGGIFLLDGGKLTRITEEGYDSETLLQRFLADHPDLLAGELIDEEEPRRWLLLAKEAALPAEEKGAGRWSVDHLFVDQDAVPTIVEVKRSSDTRIRREVVGQMLEYAANATTYWEIEDLQARFEETVLREGDDPEDVLRRALGSEIEPGAFWDAVETNLDAGNVRLLFVADEIPPELKRIVEFLNEHFERPECLAVELKQYTGEGQRALVPRVYGKTARAEKGKPSNARARWDRDRFLRVAKDSLDPSEFGAVEKLLKLSMALVEEYGGYIKWGTGAKTGSFSPIIEPLTPESLGQDASETSLYTVNTDGGFHCKFWLEGVPEAEEVWRELSKRLFSIEGMEAGHEQHCGGVVGIPPEKWVDEVQRIREAIRETYAHANA